MIDPRTKVRLVFPHGHEAVVSIEQLDLHIKAVCAVLRAFPGSEVVGVRKPRSAGNSAGRRHR